MQGYQGESTTHRIATYVGVRTDDQRQFVGVRHIEAFTGSVVDDVRDAEVHILNLADDAVLALHGVHLHDVGV